jgi:hypothetical protein
MTHNEITESDLDPFHDTVIMVFSLTEDSPASRDRWLQLLGLEIEWVLNSK